MYTGRTHIQYTYTFIRELKKEKARAFPQCADHCHVFIFNDNNYCSEHSFYVLLFQSLLGVPKTHSY